MPLDPNEKLIIKPNRSGEDGWDQSQFEDEVKAAAGIPPGGGFVTLGTNQTITGQKDFTQVIKTDDLEEVTPNAGITLTAADPGGAGDGTVVFDGNKLVITSPRNGFGDSLEVGWDTTGDPTTPEAFVLGRSNVAGFMFIMPGANFPQFICGDDQSTGAVYWDGNGNKDFRFNTLDTGPDRDNVCYFGYGGINLQDDAGDAIFIRSPQVVAGTWTLTLPDTDGAIGQVLVNQDGAGTVDWEDPPPSGLPSYGELAVTTGVTAQNTNTTPTTFTLWDTNGLSSSDVTPDHTTDNIAVTNGGVYEINGEFAYNSASNNVDFVFEFVHDLNQIGPTFTDIKVISTVETGANKRSVSFTGFWTLNDNDLCGVYVSSNSVASVVVIEGRLTIKRIA